MVLRFILAALLLLLPASLAAHHSFAAEFDSAKPVVLRGKVTKVAWMNPHVYLWVDAVDENGKITNWALESAAPIYLQGLGWTKLSLKAGDRVTVRAFRSKDLPNQAKTDAVTLPDGRVVTTGHVNDGQDAGSR